MVSRRYPYFEDISKGTMWLKRLRWCRIYVSLLCVCWNTAWRVAGAQGICGDPGYAIDRCRWAAGGDFFRFMSLKITHWHFGQRLASQGQGRDEIFNVLTCQEFMKYQQWAGTDIMSICAKAGGWICFLPFILTMMEYLHSALEST